MVGATHPPGISWRGWVAGSTLLVLSACALLTEHYLLVERQMAAEEFLQAASIIEQNRSGYGARNAVLYDLDRGMTLHLAGQYTESNRHLEEAEQRIEGLYTRSITTETGAMLTNDNALPYEGEDFEKVMIHILAALNYLFMRQLDEALVEARKVDHQLNLLNDRYEKKNVYREDAFARYLSGILFEAKGELNDAFIAYRKAYDTYRDYGRLYATPLPPTLPADLLRLTSALGLREEHRAYRREFPSIPWLPWSETLEQGEIVLLSFVGRAPIKGDFFLTAPVPDGAGGIYLLRVALPRFIERPTDVADASIELEPGGLRARSYLVEDVTAIAKKNLEDRLGRITAKAIARAAARYAASWAIRNQAAKKKDPQSKLWADLGTSLYSVAVEQADKRSWRTLPGMIRMARLTVPPGRYTVKAKYLDRGGSVVGRKDFVDISLKGGEKRFLSHYMTGRMLSVRSN